MRLSATLALLALGGTLTSWSHWRDHFAGTSPPASAAAPQAGEVWSGHASLSSSLQISDVWTVPPLQSVTLHELRLGNDADPTSTDLGFWVRRAGTTADLLLWEDSGFVAPLEIALEGVVLESGDTLRARTRNLVGIPYEIWWSGVVR